MPGLRLARTSLSLNGPNANMPICVARVATVPLAVIDCCVRARHQSQLIRQMRGYRYQRRPCIEQKTDWLPVDLAGKHIMAVAAALQDQFGARCNLQIDG